MKQTQKSLVTLRDMTFSYEPNQAPILKDVNLKIYPGEFICVVGPSGCGKSTLLNIIAGFLKNQHGEATFKEEPIDGPSWHRGVVFQNQALYPWLTVGENIAFGPENRGIPKKQIKDLVESMLIEIGMTEDIDKHVFELSGGMQQRVQLARVLVNHPELVLMDEPLGALDAITRIKMQNLIRGLWENSMSSVLMITHHIDEALTLGTRILVMKAGGGGIVKEYAVDYTEKLLKDPNRAKIVDERYLKIKEEIYKAFN